MRKLPFLFGQTAGGAVSYQGAARLLPFHNLLMAFQDCFLAHAAAGVGVGHICNLGQVNPPPPLTDQQGICCGVGYLEIRP